MRKVMPYLSTSDLIILNKGMKPTLVAAGRQTVIDITIASSDIASFVTECRVSDEESI